MTDDEKLEVICTGLKKAFGKQNQKKAITEWYDNKICKLRNGGLSDAADRWEKLKEASLRKFDNQD